MPSLYRRGKVWYSSVFVGGRRIRKALDTDKTFALKKLAAMAEMSRANKYGRPPKTSSWPEFKSQFLQYSFTLSKVSHQAHRRAIRNLEIATPILGLHNITPLLLEQVKIKWKGDNRGLYTINKDLRSLKMMMRKAEAWGMVGKQDWRSVRQEKEPKGRLRFYSVEDLKKLLGVCSGVWKTIALLGARAGLRRAEIHWLRREDIDYERNRIHIAPKEGWNPKDFERRWVPMSKDLRGHLESIKLGEWVISENGERPTIGTMTTYLSRLAGKVGLKGGPHTLRHTFASHLASAGVPLHTIAKLLGHNSVKTTEIYAHLAPDIQDAAVERLPNLL